MSLEWLQQSIKAIDVASLQQAQQRQTQLTKPAGSLGRLEEVAIRLAAMQASDRPTLDKVSIVVFAGDHGITQQGVSAYPSVVTSEMVRNFSRGGAAINVMASQQQAELEVVNVGTAHDPGKLPGVIDQRIAAGTADFSQQAAMTPQQCEAALSAGREACRRALDAGAKVFVGGEMGIGNTTSAAALACAMLQLPASRLVGPGTGLDDAGVQHKAEVIDAAIARFDVDPMDVLEVLRHYGGFEIAALGASFLSAAQNGMPVLIDGFICTVAALIAERLVPGCREWFIYGHRSAEPGHQVVLDALQAQPLLDLDMRLGEGSGAAVALSLLRHACALHNEMATFEEAAVSTRENDDG